MVSKTKILTSVWHAEENFGFDTSLCVLQADMDQNSDVNSATLSHILITEKQIYDTETQQWNDMDIKLIGCWLHRISVYIYILVFACLLSVFISFSFWPLHNK